MAATQLVRVHVMALAVGERDVEPAARDVDAEVLPEVRELQRGADRIKITTVVGERRETLAGAGRTFVGDVVRTAGERVDRRDGRSQPTRTQQRRDRKVFVVVDTHGTDCPCALALTARGVAPTVL